MNNVTVSVIIPVYNVEQYLRQCLDSVINQTYKDIEIIIVNDCSPDNSLQIIKEYQQKDERIILVNLKKNVGLGFARNEGIKVAKGIYITFVDSDDWITNDYVEVLYKEVEKNNLDVVSASAYFYDDFQKKIVDRKISSAEILNKNRIESLLIPRNKFFVIPVWLKIYRKSFLIDNNIYFKIKENEDNLFLFSIILNTKKIKFIDNKLYFYRINRKNSLMEQINKNFDFFQLFEKLKEILLTDNTNEEYKQIYYQYISIFTASKLELSDLSFRKSKEFFVKFRNIFYNKELKKYYTLKNLILLHKIRLILFYLCLKFNMNYAVIGKFLRNIIK